MIPPTLLKRTLIAAGCATLLAGVFAVAASGAVTFQQRGAQAVAIINQQRAANGIPGAVTYLPNEKACVGHEKGAAGGEWWVYGLGDMPNPFETNPYSNAPFHHVSQISPALEAIGMGPNQCMIYQSRSYLFDANAPIYTYPGNGTIGVPNASPGLQECIGDPCTSVTWKDFGATTAGPVGPPIYVMPASQGRWRLSNVALTGPRGAEPVTHIDGCAAPSQAIADQVDSAAIVVPLAPLQPATTYSMTANISMGCTEESVRSITTTFTTITPLQTPTIRLALGGERPFETNTFKLDVNVGVRNAPGPWTPFRENYATKVTVTRGAKVLSATLDPKPCAPNPCEKATDGILAQRYFNIRQGGRWEVCAEIGGLGTSLIRSKSCATRRIDLSPVHLQMKVPARHKMKEVRKRGLLVAIRSRASLPASLRVKWGGATLALERVMLKRNKWRRVRVRIRTQRLTGAEAKLLVQARASGSQLKRKITIQR